MLQRLARSVATVAKIPVPSVRRIPSKKPGASTADNIEATGAHEVAVSGVTPYSPSLPRRSPRPRNTLQSPAVLKKATAEQQSVSCLAALPADQSVKHESPDSTQPAAPALLSAHTKSHTPPSRKRKAAQADATAGDSVSSTSAGSKAAASKAAVYKEPKRSSHASTKTRPPQTAGSAGVAESPSSPGAPASQRTAASVLQQPADSPAKPTKQRRPRAKAAVKTKTAAVTPLPDEQMLSPVVKPEDGNSTAAETSSPQQAQKQKPPRTRVEVKTETVTVAELREASAEDPAVMPGDSAASKTPRKRRAKAEVPVETLLESVHVTPYRERCIPKKWVGAHVSMAGGMERAIVRAAAIGAFFTCCCHGCSLYNQHHSTQPCFNAIVSSVIVAATCCRYCLQCQFYS